MPVQTVIKKRRDTAANWVSTNPTLAAGEEGYETDTGLSKTGNGSSAWTALSYDATAHSKQMVKAGESIAKGQAVYISSSDGTNMIVSKASNATEATSSKTFGLMNGATSSGALNTVVTEGLLGGLDTSGASAGDPVWLGTSGNLIYGLLNKPVAPAHLVFIGIVESAHATTGRIFVKIQNGFELQELHNVLLESPSDNEVLAYDSGSSLWKNQTAAEAGLATVADPTFTGTLNAAEVIISGDLTVNGTTTTVSAQDLVVEDPLIYIGEGNDANLVDLGIVASFDDGTYQHTGLVRDSSAGKWKLFKGVADEPTTTVNFGQGSLDTLALGTLEASSATIGDVSNTELQYLNGVTSAVQTQLDAKAPSLNPVFTGTADFTSATVTGIQALPSQSGNTGKYLTTDGSTASWANVSAGSSDLNGLSDVVLTSSATGDVLYFDGANWINKGAGSVPVLLNSQTGGSYTLVLADAGKVVEGTNSSANTVTIPLNASVAFPVGTQVTVLQAGTGQTTINIASGGTLNAGLQGTTNTAKLRAQWSAAVLIKRATDTWVASGDLVA